MTSAEPDPIIVAGAPRTGVRLVAAILDGHPELASGPELPFLVTMARQWRDIATTLGENHARHCRIAPSYVRGSFRAGALKLVMPRVQMLGKSRFVLHSFGAAVSLDVLAELFDGAHFVITVRDPRDVAVSLLGCDWRDPRDGRPLPYTQDPIAAAQLWVNFMQLALRDAPRLEAAGRLTFVRCEDLCARPKETLAHLGSFLGVSPPLPHVPSGSAAVVTASLGNPHPALRTGSIDARRVGLWRRVLDTGIATRIEQITGPYRRRFGYA